MGDDEILKILLGLLAVVGTVTGPLLAYLVSSKKLGGELLLSDIEAVRGWAELRDHYENTIEQFHLDLLTEREKRREERDIRDQERAERAVERETERKRRIERDAEHKAEMAEIRDELAKVYAELKKCRETGTF